MDDIQLFNDDCFNIFPTLEDKSINLFILDLPYGQTALKWDSVIDLDEMWKHIKRIMKPNALIVFFCTAKFGNTLINANPKWFKYDLIWKKSRKVGFLSANKMPLRQHENIYVFKDQQGTYHPQKTKGKAYNKTNTGNNNEDSCAYGTIDRSSHLEGEGNRKINKGDRHPTSIIEDNDLGEIKGGYYRGENGKPFKRMPASKDGSRHPTSIIDHENIYVFDNPVNEEYNDLELSRNKDMREYAEKVYKFIGKGLKSINKKLGHRRAEHFFYFKTTQFGLCTNKTYNELIKKYKIDEMEEFLDYEILEALWEDAPPKVESTYNSQKTEGTPYKNGAIPNNDNVYGIVTEKGTVTKTDRHPTSIIDHENIYVFNGNNDENEDLIKYSKKVLKHIGKTKSTIKKEIPMADHFFRYSKGNFSLPTKETYEQLIELYNIDEMEEFIPFNELEGIYNPQKTEGKAFIDNRTDTINSVYGETKKKKQNNKGDRHPTSIIPEYEGDTILVYKNPHKTIHRTQKPVELLEWLIKTYSNEGDLVMDFTMGSGTCGVACINTKRKFIGVEMDKEIYDACFDRIEKHKKNL